MTKVCSRCHSEKDAQGFFKCSAASDGRQSYCKSCCRQKSTECRRKKGIPPRTRQTEPNLKSKVCNRCKKKKEAAEFRIRSSKEGYVYLNSECRQCDKERAEIYYAKVKDKPEFKERNRLRQKEYAEKNCDQIKQRRKKPEYLKKHAELESKRYYKVRDRIKAKMKIKRQTPEYKKMMKEYRKKNKERIYQKEVVTKLRYHEKHRDGLTDDYITRLLKTQGLAVTPEIIEAKRLQLLIQRKIKQNDDKN